MGTNYYLQTKACAYCGRSDPGLHIGKSSAGWCFSLHVHPDQNITSLTDWQIRWSQPGVEIVNEYGEVIQPGEMLQAITDRQRHPSAPILDTAWYAQNGAEPGPGGLARHKIDGRCIGHGYGTWDLIIGDFS